MKKITLVAIAIFAFSILTLPLYGQDTQNNQPPKEKWSLVTMEGTVTNIVKDTREITLKGTDGELVTVTASDEVKRFDEIKVGDVITFDYYTYLKAEFREPTPEELADPLVAVAESGKAPEGMDPAAIAGAVVRAVVSVEILNRPNMTATVKGPRGNFLTIEMEDEGLMQKLHIGQKVILTYAEAMALSLTKIDSKN